MSNLITITGRIVFNPKDKTKKHIDQSSWKKMGMVVFDGDICEYYSWFLNKRYSINLNTPLRGPHISFINDSINDIMNGLNVSEKEANKSWDKLVNLFSNKTIDITLDVSPKSNQKHWWLNIPNNHRGDLHNIRNLVGLDRPNYDLHLSLGYAVDKYDKDNETIGVKAKRMNVEHSQYILGLIKKGFID